MGQAVLTLDVNERSSPTRIQQARRILASNRNALIGAILFTGVVIVAIFAQLLMTHDPNFQTPSDRLLSPGADHFFGTDGQGRDVFSRTIMGSRLSLFVGISVSIFTALVGGLIGLVAGFIARLDAPLMRLMDALMAFPGIILAIGIMAVRGAAVSNVILALTVVSAPRMARVVRSVVQTTAEAQFVESAQSTGCTTSRILLRHLLPNCFSPIIVQASFVFAEAVLGEATLTFLGAGAPTDIPSWGGMLSDSRLFLSQASWTMLAPGAALTITVFALNLLGDGLRDILDPRLRGR